MKSARRNASGEVFAPLALSPPPQPQNKCQSKPAFSPHNALKTNDRRSQQVSIFWEFAEQNRCDFQGGIVRNRIQTHDFRQLEIYSTMLPSRIRCNSHKTNGRRHFYSTIFRGVFCTLCDQICRAKGPGATFKSLRCGVYFPPFSVARHAGGGQ